MFYSYGLFSVQLSRQIYSIAGYFREVEICANFVRQGTTRVKKFS